MATCLDCRKSWKICFHFFPAASQTADETEEKQTVSVFQHAVVDQQSDVKDNQSLQEGPQEIKGPNLAPRHRKVKVDDERVDNTCTTVDKEDKGNLTNLVYIDYF